MEMVKIKSFEDWQTLPVTSWGIKQPGLKEQREDALKTGQNNFFVDCLFPLQEYKKNCDQLVLVFYN